MTYIDETKKSGWEEKFDKKYPLNQTGGGLMGIRVAKESIRESHADLISRAVEALEGKKKHRKPTHGPCCTCQTCGGDISDGADCDCERNRTIDEAIATLKSLI